MNIKDLDLISWLGEDNELGISIWENKYKQGDELFVDWLDRVSGKNTAVKQLILGKRFLFAGRILSNRGVDKDGIKASMSNCYVLPEPEDSIESIYQTCSDIARTFSYGGGVGLRLSNLRPKGMKVHNTAKKTSGAVSFMDTFSKVAETIGQNGRRGALMLSMSCTHPEIEDFINVKNDLDKVTKANISVEVTDDFMRAVEGDKDWELSFTTEMGEKVVKTVKAKQLFNKLAYNNWNMAEPGILFQDNIDNWNLISEDDSINYAGVNPCITGDTIIKTAYGDKTIKELVGTKPYVYCMDEDRKLDIRQASKVWMTRKDAELIEVDFRRGKIRCTPEHLIYTLNRGWVEAQDLKPKDKLNGLGVNGSDYKHLRLTSQGPVDAEHRFIASKMSGLSIKGKDVHHIDGDPSNNKWDNLEILEHKTHSVKSNVGHKEQCGRDEKGMFKKGEGTGTKGYKGLRTNAHVTGVNFIVKSVTKLTYTEDVYDMTVPEVHNFIANDIVIHNCGEEPLPPGGSCLLGSINLSAYVNEEDLTFDALSLKLDLKTIVRAMNDILDEGIELHPLKVQRDMAKDFRQIGIGIMGLADALIKMKMRYGDKDAIDFSKSLSSVILNEVVKESARLAGEQGSYPKYDRDAISKSAFYKHLSATTKSLVDVYGLRNSQLLTIAPTGSISTMLGISGGIEPIFSTHYQRKTESLHGKDVFYNVITPIVAKVMNIKEDLSNEQLDKVFKDLPPYIVTSQILDPLKRVDMQATWQYNIDASISSTINLPNEATVEQVYDIYMYAWKSKLKGMTIFRDGCARAGILYTKPQDIDEEPQGLQRGEWESKPEDTIYLERKIKTGCSKLVLFIGYSKSQSKVVDIFVKHCSISGCKSNIDAIVILISNVLRYGGNLKSVEKSFSGLGVCPSYMRAKDRGTIVSPGFSCPTAILKAIQDLEKEMDTLAIDVDKAPSKLVENTLGINTLEDELSTHNCPECGQDLQFTGGCKTCPTCGWSKCN